MTTIFKLARRNIFRHTRYSLGSALAVAAGFLSLSLFRAYMIDIAFIYENSYQHRAMYGHVLIERTGSTPDRRSAPWDYVLGKEQQNLIEEFFKKNEAIVQEHLRFLFGTGTITNGVNQSIFLLKGYEAQVGARIRGHSWEWDAALGVPLHKAKSPDSVVLGLGLSEILGCEISPTARKVTKFGGYAAEERPFQCPFTEVQLLASTARGQSSAVTAQMAGMINGVYREIDERFINAPLDLVQRLYQTDAISAYSVLLKPNQSAFAFVDSFNQFAATRGLPVYAARWQDHKEGDLYRQTMDLLSIFRNFVVSILVAITGLSVFNTFLKAVKERTREIGTLRSIGFTPGTLLGIFGTEAAILCVAGTLLGTIMAIGLTALINFIGIPYKAGMLADPVPFRIAYSNSIYFSSALFLVLISVGAAILASRGTTRATIAENISHV